MGEIVSVSVSASQIGITYQAYIDGNPVSESVAGDGATITLDAATTGLLEGDYLIEVLAVKAGCSSISLEQNAALALSAIPDSPLVTDTQLCSGQSTTLVASGAPGGGSYNWYTSLTSTDPIPGENAGSLVVDNLIETTTYYATTVNSSGCESGERVAVTATVIIATEVESITNDAVCTGDAATLVASGAPVDGSYNWYINPDDVDPVPGEEGAEFVFAELMETTTLYVAVVNSTGCESSARVAVTAEAVPVFAVINTTNGNGCSGSSVELTASGAPENGTYNWYESAIAADPIDGANGAVFQTPVLEVSRSYFVTAVNSIGCESLVRKEVKANVEPVYLVGDVENGLGCPGESVTLTASGAPDNGSYRWYDEAGIIIEGETSATYITPALEVTTGFSVSVVNSVGCESNLVAVTAEINNEALTVQAEDAFTCGTGDVALVATGAPDGGSYQWFDEAGDLVGTDAEFVAQGIVQNTVYTVQSISATGCVSTLKEVVAGFREEISKPVIERDQDILHTSTQADSYQWFRDGDPIEGERGSSLLHTDLGAYQVEVEINGCSNISETFVVTAISDLINGELINLYPNPANKFIRILIENLTAKKYTLLVFEISGKIVFHEELTITTGKLDKELDINKYDNGVYFVKLTDGEYVYTGKFVKR